MPSAAAPRAASPPPPSAGAQSQPNDAALALQAARGAAAALPWTQARIEADGRSVVVPRARAGRLPALVVRALQAPVEAPAQGAASLRVEIAQGDEAAGVLELVGARWRWRPLREAAPARGLRLDATLAVALKEEAQRLLGR